MFQGEALAPAAVVLALAAAVPFATAGLLAALLLRGAPDGGEARARRLVSFRLAASLVGFAQLNLAWMAGARALTPIVARQGGGLAMAFGLLAVVVAFVAGGVARRIEEPAGERSTALGAAVLRLRFLPWFLGPVLAVQATAALPVIADGAVRWGWAAVALYDLAIALAALGEDEEALVEARAAVRLHEDAHGYQLLAHVEQALGQRDEAKRDLERAAGLEIKASTSRPP